MEKRETAKATATVTAAFPSLVDLESGSKKLTRYVRGFHELTHLTNLANCLEIPSP